MSTNPSHYYEPRRVTEVIHSTPTVIEDRLTFAERHGELIAAALGLIVFGFALGIFAAGAALGALA